MKKEMQMQIEWTDKAVQQRKQLLAGRRDYAGAASARKAYAEIKRLLDLAAAQPQMGKPGIVNGTRELFPMRYRVVYTVSEKYLTVIAVLPQWQKWPDE